MNGWIGRVYEYLATYGLRMFAAVVILVVGWWAARFIFYRVLTAFGVFGKKVDFAAEFAMMTGCSEWALKIMLSCEF